MKTCIVCKEDCKDELLCKDCSGVYYDGCRTGNARWVDLIVCCHCCNCQPEAIVLTQPPNPTRLMAGNQARAEEAEEAEDKEVQELLLRVRDLIAAIEMLSAERAMLWRRYVVEFIKHLEFTESQVSIVLNMKGIAEDYQGSQRSETGGRVWGSSATSRQKLKSYS